MGAWSRGMNCCAGVERLSGYFGCAAGFFGVLSFAAGSVLRALARVALSRAAADSLEASPDWSCLRAASGVAPLVPPAGWVGGVVGLGVDVASLPPVAG
jgi:hypothetical protein